MSTTDFAHAAETCAGNARCQDRQPRKDGKAGQETNHHGDLVDHGLDAGKNVGDVDHRDGRIGEEERALHGRNLARIEMHAAVPGGDIVLELTGRQDKGHAPADVLPIRLVERRDFQLVHAAGGGLHFDFRSDMQVQPPGRAFAHGDFVRTRIGPPLSLA